jgi:hypothetical protein
MSLLLSREFDMLYDEWVGRGWESRENTGDTLHLVSPGNLAEFRVVMTGDRAIRVSVPIRFHEDPYATQYVSQYTDAGLAARFGEMHMSAWR